MIRSSEQNAEEKESCERRWQPSNPCSYELSFENGQSWMLARNVFEGLVEGPAGKSAGSLSAQDGTAS